MSTGDTFVNHGLVRNIYDAHLAGVFPDMGVVDEDEDRYVSELERRMIALDEKSVYVAVKTFVENHRKTLVNTLEYMEGEKHEQRRNQKRVGEQISQDQGGNRVEEK